MAAEDVIAASKEKLEPLLAPIDGGAGADLSYDELFEAVKNEVDKMTSLSGGKVDWAAITSNAEQMLTEKGKDFRVALYYATARAQLDGVQGLFEGFLLLQELTAAFWDTMGPPLKRPKARGSLCAWFSDATAAAFQTYQPSAKERDLVKALDTLSRGLDGDLSERLGEAYGGMGKVRSAISNLVRALPPEAPPPPPPPPPAPPKPVVESAPAVEPLAVQTYSAPAQTGGGPSAESITDTSAAMRAVPEIGRMLARIGDLYRAADPTDAVAYRMSRMGLWIELEAAPPNDGGTTLLPPPPGDAKERFESFLAAENWAGLIEAADAIAAEYILWLDPHRYVATALEKMGADAARNALMREVAGVLLRAEGLHTLTFNDGTPIADDDTKAWIEGEVLKAFGGGGGGGGGAAAPRKASSPIDGAIAEAKNLAANGQLQEALAVVAKALRATPRPADRFRGQLEAAKLCLENSQFSIAKAQLEGLDRLAERHRLDEWEPALCVDMYAALFAAHRGASSTEETTPEARARQAAVFEKLCQLDAGAALRLMIG